MKKTNNRLVTNEAAVMPSYFKSLKTTESHPLISWEYLMKFITSDPMLKIYTETYRKRLAVSKKFADAYKPEEPGITISYIENGECTRKLKLRLPEKVDGILTCKNPRCISNVERLENITFYLVDAEKKEYACEYCEARTKL